RECHVRLSATSLHPKRTDAIGLGIAALASTSHNRVIAVAFAVSERQRSTESTMSGDFDPRDLDSRERDDGIHDREDEWLTIGRGPGSSAVRDGNEGVRSRDDDWREERSEEHTSELQSRFDLVCR